MHGELIAAVIRATSTISLSRLSDMSIVRRARDIVWR